MKNVEGFYIEQQLNGTSRIFVEKYTKRIESYLINPDVELSIDIILFSVLISSIWPNVDCYSQAIWANSIEHNHDSTQPQSRGDWPQFKTD